ncbi:MAG: glycosyltransferase [Anaerolineales bacterium]|nr:glycosyltransferase [Anaerolineales bacterium]
MWYLVLTVLILLSMIAVLNTLTFPRLRPGQPAHRRRVSLLVPARDEAGKIAATVQSLLAQDYPDFEVLLLDDQSQDGTAEIARQAAGDDARLRILSGQPLPPGWLGKNWACQQLAQQASGEILVFTDADVRWQPSALGGLLAILARQRAGMLTIWPTQAVESWSERLVVPMMTFVILAYLPELAVRYIPWPVLAAANGQCLVFRRKVYDRIGGHQAVGANVIEDMGLAWNSKRAGARLVQILGNGLIGTRMYTNWAEVRAGFAKNILAGHGNRPLLLLLSAGFHWLLFLLPWAWLALGWLPGLRTPTWPQLPLALVALGLSLRLLSAAATRHHLRDALLLPISVLLMTVIAGQALLWHWRGGGTWKGRNLTPMS